MPRVHPSPRNSLGVPMLELLLLLDDKLSRLDMDFLIFPIAPLPLLLPPPPVLPPPVLPPPGPPPLLLLPLPPAPPRRIFLPFFLPVAAHRLELYRDPAVQIAQRVSTTTRPSETPQRSRRARSRVDEKRGTWNKVKCSCEGRVSERERYRDTAIFTLSPLEMRQT